MNILDIVIGIFIILESLNVCILYFAPDLKIGNGVAVFSPWFKAKEDEEMELFAKYMANWVAGSKLIFIVLLLVILFTGDNWAKLFSVIGMILSISTYFIRLAPIIKKLDNLGKIIPKGYSKTLFFMILGFVLMFIVAIGIYFVF